MGFASASFLFFGAAGLGLGGMLGLALGLYVHHARRSRVAAFSINPFGTMEEGPALLGGTVEVGDDEPPSPVLSVSVPRPPAQGQQTYARSFTLALPSGATLRVEPEEGRWSLDTTFLPTAHDGQTVYQAVVDPGDVVYVQGSLHREIDPRAAGKSYRDVARRWVLRGELSFCSAAVIAAHAQRAAFHRDWALGLGALFALVHGAIFLASDPSSGLGAGSAILAIAFVAGVALRYHARAVATAPWIKRKVRVR